MSISLLTNAKFMNLNVGSVVQPIQINTVLGDCDFLGTDVPAADYTCNAYVFGDIVTLSLYIPSTAATAVRAITFTNPLPQNLWPAHNFIQGTFYAFDLDDAAHGVFCYIQINDDGTVLINLDADATDTEHYTLNLTATYSLV